MTAPVFTHFIPKQQGFITRTGISPRFRLILQLMKKHGIEIAAHLAFWALTTWVLLRMFGIESQRIEIVDGVEEVEVVFNDVFQHMLLLGQVFRAGLFYFTLLLTARLNRGDFSLPKFWLYAVAAFQGFYLLGQMISKAVFFTPEPVFSLNLSLGIFGFYFAIALATGFTKGWLKKEQDRQQLSLEKKEAELNLLRSQLHPHFLFNTLNNLLAMAQQSTDPKLPESIGRLSELLRFSIYETQGGSIPLEKEVAFLRHFIELNLIRYEEGEVDLQFRQEGETTGLHIEPGILLPFVENAFKYGVMPEEPSFIHIDLRTTPDGQLFFKIKNPIHMALDTAPLNRGGIGLDNTRRRLELVYPGRHQLRITENEYFTVELTIDLHENHHR